MHNTAYRTPHVVYHVAAMGNWTEVVSEQLLLLRTSGLAGALTEIGDAVNVTYVGDPSGMQFMKDEAARQDVPIRIIRHDPNIMHYETFAMLEIERIAKVDLTDRHILYFHTKGVSVPHCQEKIAWRRVMSRYVIEMWEDNVTILDGGCYDAVGWNWWSHGNQHFSGTFWIARADWIRKLPDYVHFHHSHNLVRYSCELWIGAQASPTCRAYSRGVSGEVTWQGGYDFSRYLESKSDIITWLSAASCMYAKDLGHLAHSSIKLGRQHKVIARVIGSEQPWNHRMKLKLIASMLDDVKTSHAFWVDADCEFLCQLSPGDLIAPDKPLSCVQHLAYNQPSDGPGFCGPLLDMTPKGARGYWQACMWGGEVGAFRAAVERCEGVLSKVASAHDEHALNVDIQNNQSLYHTLPCRYAAPTDFSKMPQYQGIYNSRSGGPPRILHFNREISRS